MKKLLLFTLTLCSLFSIAQSPGDIISIEKKLDISPGGISDLIHNNSESETPSELIEHLEDIQIGLVAYKLTYYTTDYYDNLVKATGLVMYPKSYKKLSTVLYCHPTTDRRENVPSNLKDVVQVGFVLPLSYALNNYIVIAPDFYGMGDGDGTQNYGEAKTTANSILDMMKAGNTFLDQMNIDRYDENFITGYSLGAHAGMATLRDATQNNLYKFKHAYLGAGPMDMSESTLERGVIDKTIFPISAFLANIVYTADKLEGNIRDGGWDSVIKEPYLDDFIDATVEDNGGIFWGPIVWRNLFTDRVIDGITNDPNHPLRIYLAQNNVYDWYNTTPTTLTDGFLDTIIHPSNNAVTLDVQRSYYPWWSFSKYKIKRVQVGPFTHITGILPWIIGSIHRFNSLRKGGYFNLRAEYTNNNYRHKEALPTDITLNQSSISPEFLINGEQLNVSLSKISSDKNTQYRTQNIEIKNAETGFYLAETTINGKKVKFPYVIEPAIELPLNEILKSKNETTFIDLNDLEDNVKAINIFDNNNKKVTTLDLQTKVKNQFTIDSKALKEGYTIEIVTNNTIFTAKVNADSLTAHQDYLITTNKNSLNIASLKGNIQSIEVYNLLGQVTHSKKSINKDSYTFKSTSGVNIVKITNDKGETTTRKVML